MSANDTNPEKPARARSVSGFLISVALFMALLAVAGVGWNSWQLMALTSLSERVSRDDNQIRELTQRIDRLAEDLLEQRQSALAMRSSFEGRLTELNDMPVRLEQVESQVASIPGINQQSRNDWLKTEALYYLRIANAQALLAGDGEVAASALRLADEKLRESGDPALSAVRAKLANEIAALEAMPVVDRAGISFRLQSLINMANSWPLRATAPERFSPAAPEVTADLGAWNRFVTTIKKVFLSIVSIKQTDERPVAQLSAAEQALVVESIKAELQVARLAFATNNAELFAATLERAAGQIELYFDTEASSVLSALAAIAEIQAVERPAGMPDISGSLALMLAAGKPDLQLPARTDGEEAAE